MKKLVWLLVVLWGFALLGCAAKQEFVKEAAAVKTDALEPVIFRSDKLVASLKKNKLRFMEKDEIEELMTDIKSQVEQTKRFTYVMVLDKHDVTAETEGFIIYPEVQSMKMDIRNTIDPQRKRYVASGSACLKVYDAENSSKEMEIFTSRHSFEKMGQISRPHDANKQMKDLLRTIFLDLAIQLGDQFNPSYVMGTIEKISGKTAYVHIKTDQLRNLKAKQQQIAVVDDDNKPLASIEPISIEDGSLTGIFNAKAKRTIKTGMTVRARIYKSKY
jgi:uncharacterized protein YcfL